jgi:hypothetical protein
MPKRANTVHAAAVIAACRATSRWLALRMESRAAKIASRASRKPGFAGVSLRASRTSCAQKASPMVRLSSINVAHQISPRLCGSS